MVNSNSILYSSGEHPDHVVVIKYVPYVADSKRAMDEYTSEIFMGGRNTIALHNTCEDSLLAAPIILDLAILTELLTRIEARSSQPLSASCPDILTSTAHTSATSMAQPPCCCAVQRLPGQCNAKLSSCHTVSAGIVRNGHVCR